MKYKVVDVFTDKALKGNPVAVVLDEAGALSSDEMQSVARWTNLSETTFVVPTQSRADYKVRIFTTQEELPFAGHPTLGTSHAVREWGLVDRAKSSWTQECIRGEIKVTSEQSGSNEILTFGIGGITSSPVSRDDVAECLPGLTVVGQPLLVDAGPHWMVASLKEHEQALLDYIPVQDKLTELCKKYKSDGLCVFAKVNDSTDDIQLRTLVSFASFFEDPVCGSGNAAVAYYRNLQNPYTSFQGSAVHRDGRIRVAYHGDQVWIGGACKTVVDGNLNL